MAVMARLHDRAAKDEDLTPGERKQAKQRANLTRRRAKALRDQERGEKG